MGSRCNHAQRNKIFCAALNFLRSYQLLTHYEKGGHSDALMGTLSVKSLETWKSLWHTRTYLGLVPGSMEQWLVLRSLRTLHLRVPKQAETGTKIAQWLNGRKEIEKV